MKKMRACISCKLVLNKAKWVELQRCPNCPSAEGLSSTTESFSNIIGQIYPKMSWVAQYQNMKDFIPGLYAMNVNVSELQENIDEDEY